MLYGQRLLSLLATVLLLAAHVHGKVITSNDWHRANKHKAAREVHRTEEGITTHLHEVTATNRMKGSYRVVSALDKQGGPRGFHAEDLWREGKWATFEPVHANRVRVATAEPHSVRKGDVLHLDMFTAAHVRALEDSKSVPATHYRVTSVALSGDGQHVEYEIRPCALNELFQNLELDVTIDFPRNSPTFIDGKQLGIAQPSAKTTKTPDAPRLRREKEATSFSGIIHNMAKKAYKRMDNLADKVKDAVEFASAVFDFLTTGDTAVDFTKDMTVINYHYDTASKEATCTLQMEDVFGTDVTGTCENCYAYAGLSVTFVVKIEDYEVKEASVKASGGIDLSVQSSFEITGEYENEVLVTTFHNSFEIPVSGIPINVVIDTPVTLSIDATATATLPVDIFFRAMVDAGIAYDPTQPSGIVLTNTATFDAAGNGLDLAGLSFTEGSVNLGIRADSWIKIYNIGGPIISLGATPELGMESNADPTCSVGLVSSSVGVEGTLGGKIVIKGPTEDDELLNQEATPVSILNTKHNIHTGCFGVGSTSSRMLATAPLPPVGTSYDGSLVTTSSGVTITQTFSAQVTYLVTTVRMELIVNAYGATSSGVSDGWNGYIFDIYSDGGASILQTCNHPYKGYVCEGDYGSYSESTGASLVPSAMLCTYDYTTAFITCDSLDGGSKVTMEVHALDTTVGGMSVRDARAQVAATICTAEDDNNDGGGDDDKVTGDDDSAAAKANALGLLLSIAMMALVAL